MRPDDWTMGDASVQKTSAEVITRIHGGEMNDTFKQSCIYSLLILYKPYLIFCLMFAFFSA